MILVNISCLFKVSFSRVNLDWLINLEVLSINDEAISWDTSTSLKKDNVTYDDIPDTNALSGSEFTSNYWY